MATFVFEDLVVPEGEVRTYTQNSDFGHVGALEFAPPDPSGSLQPSLTNYGEMRLQPDAAPNATQLLIRFATDCVWDKALIRNFGVISAMPTADHVVALFATAWSPDLFNAGTIVAEGRLSAKIYESWDSSLTINNTATGLISAKGESAVGFYLGNGATITNAGTIVATAMGGSANAIIGARTTTITNSGLIQASDNSPDPNAVAILFHAAGDGNTLVNSGTIRGDYAVKEYNYYEYDARAMVQNTGLIEGLISLVHGNDRVINAGQIVGDVDLGADYDFYDGRLGTIVGTVLGGGGNDLLIGGTGRDTLNGGGGADALFARGGDTLTGGSGGDIFVYTAATAGAPAEAITDFVSGTDRIDLSSLAPTSITINGSTVSAVTAAGTLTIQVNGTVALADIATATMATVTGTAGDDTLVAGPEGAVLGGGDGADLLVGGIGNDRLDGGRGSRDSSGTDYGDVMRGGAGDDTYVVNDQVRDDVVEDFDSGFDTVEFIPEVDPRYALPDNIEKVIGGGTDGNALYGNALDNVMVGSSGGDLIEGGDGADTLIGGLGADTLDGGAGADVFVYLSATESSVWTEDRLRDFAHGTDKIDLRAIALTSLSFGSFYGSGTPETLLTAGTQAGVTLAIRVAGTIDATDVLAGYIGPPPTISGTDGGDLLVGTGGADVIAGFAGNDGLIGRQGDDTLLGGPGDDGYVVEDIGDVVIERAGEGTDTVYTTIGYALAAGSEVETLTVYDRTTTETLSLYGNAFGQLIYGNDGTNLLSGGGGADTLFGMGGNDAYLIDGANDVVYEFAGGGYDVIHTTGSFELSYSSEIELITVEDRSTTNAANLFGNAFGQTLYGNAGANALNGGGGADVLVGFGGDDSYVVDSLDDVVLELAGQGSDAVYAMGSYALDRLAEVELLSAYERSSTDAIRFTGSAFGQTIFGTMGSNFLNGNGGADVIYGLGGDDKYLVDGLEDQVLEFAGQGTDTVYAASHFVLTAGSEVEVLTVYDRTTSEAINLAGNELANTIYGNAGSNVIDGKAGSDAIYLMGGADAVRFTSPLGSGNVDTIVGFTSGEDALQLDGAIFAGLAPGSGAPGALVVNALAADGDDRLLYNETLGQLFFDADGSGAGAAVLFATLDPGTLLAASDFWVM